MSWLAEQLSNEQEGLGGDADLSCAVLPPEGEARPPHLQNTTPGRASQPQRRGVNLLVFALAICPFGLGPPARAVKPGSVWGKQP